MFWVYGVLTSIALSVGCFFALLTERSEVQQIALIIALAYTIWVAVSVWRCAENVKCAVYSRIARCMTAVWAFSVTMFFGSLQIRLFDSYIRTAGW